jgi:hypothetical protein
MTYFLLFLLSSMGLTHIIVDSSIAEEPVKWLKNILPKKILWFHPAEALDCHQCTGFWIGLLCSVIWGIPWMGISLSGIYIWLMLVRWILCGCVSSVVCLWVSHYFTYLQARAIIDLGDMEEDES